MQKWTLSSCICAAAFIIMTVVKVSIPSALYDLSEGLSYLEEKSGLAATAELCGELLSVSDESISAEADEAVYELSPDEDDAVETETLSRSIIMPQCYYNFRTLAQKTIMEASEKKRENARQRESVTAAFKASQEAFMSDGLPEAVSYECPELGIEYVTPIPGITSSGFGYRLHPIYGVVKFHYGTDFAAGQGETIAAFADGEVTLAAECDSYGKYIIISHAGGCETLYAHCSELLVSTGMLVTRGDAIALVGSTGLATGPHLHFELKKNGVYLNPEYYTAVSGAL